MLAAGGCFFSCAKSAIVGEEITSLRSPEREPDEEGTKSMTNFKVQISKPSCAPVFCLAKIKNQESTMKNIFDI